MGDYIYLQVFQRFGEYEQQPVPIHPYTPPKPLNPHITPSFVPMIEWEESTSIPHPIIKLFYCSRIQINDLITYHYTTRINNQYFFNTIKNN